MGRTGKAQVNNAGVVKKGWSNMCAPAIVNLYIQTKVDLFLITRGNIELWAIHSGQNSQCPKQPLTLSPPLLVPLLFLVDGQHMHIYGTRDTFTEKIAYTLPSDAYYYTSLEFNDI